MALYEEITDSRRLPCVELSDGRELDTYVHYISTVGDWCSRPWKGFVSIPGSDASINGGHSRLNGHLSYRYTLNAAINPVSLHTTAQRNRILLLNIDRKDSTPSLNIW